MRRVAAIIRVVIVDDSALMRRMITSALSSAPDIIVVGAACDAIEGRELIRSASPDVVTLDIAMPGMNGLDFLRKIMELRPTPVIMVSSLTAEGAEVSINALQIGAIEVVQKPQGREALANFGALLQSKVRLAAAARFNRREHSAPERVAPALHAVHKLYSTRSLIAIGASTGGVGALSKLLSELPAGLPPITIVQHMPKGYPERLAARLSAQLHRDVAEARHGEVLVPGAIRIAPGDRHLRVVRRNRGAVVELDEGPPVTGHCPSVDVLFESVARAFGPTALGIILTGMGRDGATGLAAMRRAGSICLGQGRESSVVWGMPRAALEMNALDEEAELESLPRRICHYLSTPLRSTI